MSISSNKNDLFMIDSFLNESKSVIYFSTNFEGKIITKNGAYESILHYTADNIKPNLLNPIFDDLLNEEKNGLVFDGILTMSKTGSNISFSSKVYRDEKSLLFICEYNSSEIESLYRKMASDAGVINNINRELLKTKFTLTNTIEELKETQSMLIHSEKMNALGHLVTGIAHEINNPLSYVIGNVEVIEDYFNSLTNFINSIPNSESDDILKLKEKYDLDEILDDLPSLYESTLNGANRVSKIVAELRDYSRIDSSEFVFCSIEECISSALVIANNEIAQKDIKLTFESEKTKDIEGFPAQLNQVFLNLIVNAVHAVDQQGEIAINISEVKSNIQITIKDNGVGISKENISKIYDAFYTTKPPGMGLGLGLNIAYKIITDMHHGQILVDSTIGEGTTFTVLLPIDISRYKK